MKRRALLFLLCLAPAVAACSRSRLRLSTPPPLKTLTVDQVAQRIAAHDGRTFVYDNNPKEVYQSGHIPGARWVKFDAVTASDLPGDHTATLIFYCASEA